MDQINNQQEMIGQIDNTINQQGVTYSQQGNTYFQQGNTSFQQSDTSFEQNYILSLQQEKIAQYKNIIMQQNDMIKELTTKNTQLEKLNEWLMKENKKVVTEIEQFIAQSKESAKITSVASTSKSVQPNEKNTSATPTSKPIQSNSEPIESNYLTNYDTLDTILIQIKSIIETNCGTGWNEYNEVLGGMHPGMITKNSMSQSIASLDEYKQRLTFTLYTLFSGQNELSLNDINEEFAYECMIIILNTMVDAWIDSKMPRTFGMPYEKSIKSAEFNQFRDKMEYVAYDAYKMYCDEMSKKSNTDDEEKTTSGNDLIENDTFYEVIYGICPLAWHQIIANKKRCIRERE